MDFIKKNGKGIFLCLLIAIPAWLLVKHVKALEVIGAPVIAILAGAIITLFLKDKSHLQSGISFVSKNVLQYAVILLGFGLNLTTVSSVGLSSLPIILSTITTSLIVAFLMQRLLKIPAKSATLIGVGSSICGGSAIAATAPVIGSNDEEIAQAISVIFLFNIIAALTFPALGSMLGLSNTGFGLFAGTAVNDTSSVTATASTWDTLHGTHGAVLEYATIVKLTRTLAIIPITLALAFIRMKKQEKKGDIQAKKLSLKSVFPVFILYFAAASLITTILTALCTGKTLTAANEIFSILKQLSKFLIVAAMGAVGLNTELVKLVKTGAKPIILGAACWVAISFVSLFLQRVLQIW